MATLVLRDGPAGEHFVKWAAARCKATGKPELEVVRLPTRLDPRRLRGPNDYAKVAFWLPVHLPARPAELRDQMYGMESQYAESNAVFINPPERCDRTIKSVASKILIEAGLRAPRMMRLEEAQSSWYLDFGMCFVRQDMNHGGPMLVVSPGADPYALAKKIEHPVVVELIDVRSRDGYYRKYRYVMIGPRGFNRHLIIGQNWVTRPEDRVDSTRLRAEEADFLLRPNPHHAIFERARQALGLDYVAFDYGLGADGEPVIWEANVFPVLWGSASRAEHWPLVERIYERLLELHA